MALANETQVATKLHFVELTHSKEIAAVRNELKQLDKETYMKLEEELDTLQLRHNDDIQRLTSQVSLNEQRRNASREQMREEFQNALEKMENKFLRGAIGATVGLTSIALAVIRLIG